MAILVSDKVDFKSIPEIKINISQWQEGNSLRQNLKCAFAKWLQKSQIYEVKANKTKEIDKS